MYRTIAFDAGPQSDFLLFQIPYLSPMDLSMSHDLHPAVTDSGLCYAYNGRSVGETFRDSSRTSDLRKALDSREATASEQVRGTGAVYRKTFWLNLADRQGS